MTPELGKLITDEQERDAVHIAIFPAIAGEKLYPGQHVYLLNGKAVLGAANTLGIVDPFLKEPVYPDTKFWLCVYPNTITSLRHNWTHPAFARPIKNLDSDSEQVKESKRWLEEMAEHGYVTYEELLDMADKREFRFGTEMYDYPKEQFWQHYQIVTGQVVGISVIEDTYFSCSC